MSENETGQTDLGGDILGVAKKVASAGDRWFVSFARGLGRAAGRLRKETDIVTSSAKSAAATTGRVTAKMVSRMKPRLVLDPGSREDGQRNRFRSSGRCRGSLRPRPKHPPLQHRGRRDN
jgi:type IV secretory pathway TrbL component